MKLFEAIFWLQTRVVFVDIDLPGKNGLDLAREIFVINPWTYIVFATGYDNHMDEAYEVYAFDYLVKPFKLDRMKKTMERIRSLWITITRLGKGRN